MGWCNSWMEDWRDSGMELKWDGRDEGMVEWRDGGMVR